MNEFELIERLKLDESFFDERFSRLAEDFEMDCPWEVKGFLKEHCGIFVLFDELKPFLDESFSDARFDLEVYYDPEISNCVRLDLTILVHPDRFLTTLSEELDSLRFKIRPAKRRLGLISDFDIMPGFYDV